LFETIGLRWLGHRLPWIVFQVLAFLSALRSLVHLFAPDGGAGSIAA